MTDSATTDRSDLAGTVCDECFTVRANGGACICQR